MKIFMTDGTATGFYTAVFDAYRYKDSMITSRDMQLGLDSEVTDVTADDAKAARVRKRIDGIDKYAAGDIDLALRSNEGLKNRQHSNT